jgi:acyl-CoA thioesterase
LAAIILRAITEALSDPTRPIRSFTTHFVAAPGEGTVTVTPKLERAGRSMTFMSARVEQDGKPMALSLAAFSPEWKGIVFENSPAPNVTSPEESFELPFEGEGVPAFLSNFDMRWAIGEKPFTGAAQAEVGGWFRMRDPVVADSCVMACLLDAWAPAIFPVAEQPVIAPTIDLTMHFRSPLPLPEAQAEDFYLGRFHSSVAREGFFEEDGEIWSKDGLLLAQSRQLALGLT